MSELNSAEHARTLSDCICAHMELMDLVVQMRQAIGTQEMEKLIERASQHLQILWSNSLFLERSSQVEPRRNPSDGLQVFELELAPDEMQRLAERFDALGRPKA